MAINHNLTVDQQKLLEHLNEIPDLLAGSDFAVGAKPVKPRKIRPLFDKVLARPIPDENIVNGIHIPDTAQERPVRATVVAVGEDVPPVIRVGATIYHGRYAGSQIKLNNEYLLLLRGKEDILAIDVEEGDEQ